MIKKGKVIAVASTKGGPGKTTLSGNIGDALALLGYKVAFLDLDPNENLTHWFNKGKEISAATGKPNNCFEGITLETQMEEDRIIKDCHRLARDHDFVVTDGAGVASKALYIAAGAASIVIIPAEPSEDDIKEAIKTRRIVASAAEMISERIGKDFDIPARILINSTQTSTSVHEHAAQSLERKNFPVFKTTVGSRTIFKKARFAGSTVVRLEPTGIAAREIMNLVHEVLALLGEERDEIKIAS